MTRTRRVSHGRRRLRAGLAAAGVVSALLAAAPVGSASAASAQDAAAVYLLNPNSGLCLNVAGYSQNPGTHTEIWNCLSQPAEKWQVRSDGTIYNPNSCLCLNVAAYAISPSSYTELWYCNGNYAEKWIQVAPAQ
jgi:hypothetical protein